MLAAFAILGCSTIRNTVTEHRHADSIAVEARKAESLTSRESVYDYIREDRGRSGLWPRSQWALAGVAGGSGWGRRGLWPGSRGDRKSTRLNSSHQI